MAYIAPTYDEIRKRYLEDPAGGPRVTPPSFVGSEGGSAPAGNTPPPVSTAGSGGRFAALRGFLSANQGTAEAQAQGAAQGIESKAQEAVTKADESARLPENFGGYEAASQAQSAKDEAQSKITAAQGDSAAEVFDRPKDARYSEGEKAADSALYGRTEAFKNLGKWNPILSALNPTYRPAFYLPGMKQGPWTPEEEKRVRDNWSWLYKPGFNWDSMKDFGDSAGDVARVIGDKVGDVARKIVNPRKWF